MSVSWLLVSNLQSSAEREKWIVLTVGISAFFGAVLTSSSVVWRSKNRSCPAFSRISIYCWVARRLFSNLVRQRWIANMVLWHSFRALIIRGIGQLTVQELLTRITKTM